MFNRVSNSKYGQKRTNSIIVLLHIFEKFGVFSIYGFQERLSGNSRHTRGRTGGHTLHALTYPLQNETYNLLDIAQAFHTA